MSLRAFPLELLQMIVSGIDSVNDLLTLRSVSKILCSLATPRAFRVFRITDTATSAENLQQLAALVDLMYFVQEIVFTYQTDSLSKTNRLDNPSSSSWDGDLSAVSTLAERDHESPNDSEYDATRTSLETAFHQIHRFQRLHTLRLTFDRTFDSDEWFVGNTPGPLPIQLSILKAISTDPRPPLLHSLHLSNLVASHNNLVYDDPGFRKLIASLKALEIHVLSKYNAGGTYIEDAVCEFWEGTIPRCLLSPAQSSLTSLILHNDQYVGLNPGVATEGLYYPNLVSLSFGHLLLSDVHGACDVEGFIISHKATLRRVELHDCPIFVSSTGPQKVWSWVWERFETEMGALLELVVKRTPNGDGRVEEYVALDMAEGWGYLPEYDPVPGAEEDICAYEKLQFVLEARRVETDVQ